MAMTSIGRVTFAGSSIFRFECSLRFFGALLEGPIEKVAGNAIGQVTAVQITNCSGLDSATVLGLPWAIVYLASDGVLPDAVSGVRVGIPAFEFEMRGLPIAGNCLWGGLWPLRLLLAGSNPYAAGTLVGLGSAAPLLRRGGGIFCPASGWFDGSLTLGPAQTISLM